MSESESNPKRPDAPKPVLATIHGRTDVGQHREHNEDNFVIVNLADGRRDLEARPTEMPERGLLLVVCDGMGGAAAGEIASQMAVDVMAERMLASDPGKEAPQLAEALRNASYEANDRILREALSNSARTGMGTTMTALLVRGQELIFAQVGDSRAYVWRQGEFTQLTRDQSLVNQLIESGQITQEQAKHFEHSNVILQALGVQEDVEVQLSRATLRRGDRVILCSDGLVGTVTDEEIGAVVGAVDDPAEASRVLCEMANGAGGPDNITAIVAHFDGDGIEPPAEDEILRYQLWKLEVKRAPRPVEDTFGPQNDHETGRYEAPQPRPSAFFPKTDRELASVGLLFLLCLMVVAFGSIRYGRAILCRVVAPVAGYHLIADGHDSGIRTKVGATPIRLLPGAHALKLTAAAGQSDVETVEVRSDRACQVEFSWVHTERQ